jgi:hypothetical protein
MSEDLQQIKKLISDFCRKSESIEVRETTDSAGNSCLEWKTQIILELLGTRGQKGKEERLSRQHIPVQFDVSFDITHQKIMVFLQWGKVEPELWDNAREEIEKELEKEGNVKTRYYTDRQVIELCARYPVHEFDFAFVYEEVVSFFGIANGLIFKNANPA